MADLAEPMKAEGRTFGPSASFVDHLGELRRRLIFTLAAFVVSLSAAMLFVRDIYLWLVRDLDDKLAILAPSDVVWVYFMLAGVVALAVTIPVAAWQAWQFVKPALDEARRRTTLAYIPALALLFIAGLAFGYFVVYPMVLGFLEGLSGEFETVYTASKYFSFMLNMTVPFGLLFEMPAVVLFLTRIGIVTPKRLARARKLAYFALTVTAVMITPPDIMSDLLVIVPLFLLYEISVALSKWAGREKSE